jgi:predicted cupin superfamily sugar epimerase
LPQAVGSSGRLSPPPSRDLTADRPIERLELKPHPEGGFCSQTYRAAETIATEAAP